MQLLVIIKDTINVFDKRQLHPFKFSVSEGNGRLKWEKGDRYVETVCASSWRKFKTLATLVNMTYVFTKYPFLFIRMYVSRTEL